MHQKIGICYFSSILFNDIFVYFFAQNVRFIYASLDCIAYHIGGRGDV